MAWRTGRAMARRVAAVALAATVAVGLTACDWRRESANPTWPTPDALELTRDAEARAAADLLAALGTADSTEALTIILTRNAPVYVQAWGEVYIPYPAATPSAAPRVPDLERAARNLGALSLRDALTSTDPAQALIGASTAVSLSVALDYEYAQRAALAGTPMPVVAERTLTFADGTSVGVLPAAASAIAAADLAELALQHDQAAYLYDVIAARNTGTVREEALARSAIHSARAQALVAAAGTDLRLPAYAVDAAARANLSSLDAAARATERALGERYVALTHGVRLDGERWLLNAAFDALAAAQHWPGASADEIAALPGVVLPTTS